MFKLVYTSMPTDAELDEIEQVALVDEVPPATPLGTGSTSVLFIGETEKGVFTPQRVSGVTDYASKYGGLGWTTSEGKSQGAVARRSCGSIPWEGNLYTARNRKRFGGLVICRVDGSAGSVQFRRLAAIRGGKGPFSATNGTTITFQRNGAIDVVATLTGAAARIVGLGGTYPTGFVGGETLELEIDGQGPRVVVMTATEQTLTNVIDRINAVLALQVASDVGGELAISSVIEGTDGYVKIVGGTALTTLGLVSTPVQDVWAWTVTNAQIGVYTLRVTALVNGVSTNFDITHNSADAVIANLAAGLLAAAQAASVPGATFTAPAANQVRLTGDANVLYVSATVQAEVSPGDITVAHTPPFGQAAEATGTGNVPNLAFIEAADAAAVFGALANLDSYVDSQGYLWVAESATPGSGKLQATAGAYADFGFDGVLADAANGDEVTLPAGRRLRDSLGQLWVTMEDVDTDTSGGPFSVKVRPWADIDTALPALANTITEVVDEMPGYWAVTNASEVKRLSAAQMDVRYEEAMNRTLDLNSEAADCRIILSARHSAYINKALKANAIEATKAGLDARIAIVSPPPGTSKANALSEIHELGVAKMRTDRVVYCFPEVRITVSEIRSVGAVGGVGFSDDGVIEQTSDSFYAFFRSKIRPEQSAGMSPRRTNAGELQIDSLGAAFEAQLGGIGLVIDDYIQFKAKGIVALRLVKALGYVFQSDVTSVLRATNKAEAPAYRRFMTDMIIDDSYDVAVVFKDDINSPATRQAIREQLAKYLGTLKNGARIENFSVYLDSSKAQLEAGLLIYRVKVKLYGIIQAIALRLQVGAEGVEIEEIAA